jgi:hypothetical protein
MPYSPLDTFDADDFSHLPTADGPLTTTKRLIQSPQSKSEIAPVLPQASEWLSDEIAVPPDDNDVSTSPLDFSNLTDIADDHLQESLQPESASSIPTSTPSLIQPFVPDEPEVPADNTPQIYEAKKRAFALAAGVHLVLLLLLAVVQVVPLSRPSAEIVAISSVDSTQDPAWKKIAQPAPSASASPSLQPIVALGNSQIALPDVDFTPTSTELNVGSTFGTFGGGSGTAGGSVSFMGNQGKGSRVVFVVDVSGSMSASSQSNGKTISRFELLKKELSKSLNQLRGGVQYQVIYFSDFAWPHDEVDTNDPAAMAKYEWDIRPGQQGVRIPRYRYLAANPANLTKSRKIIDDSVNPGGTNWGAGLLMALAGTPKPDLIFFMTDGNRSDALTWVDEITASNAKGKPATIHTTAMMEPAAAKELDELARRNGGKFTVIKADGKVTKGEDFFKTTSP